MLTGMERFQAVMTGRLPDRVPVVCNLLDQGAAELGMGLREFYAKGEHVARGRLQLREKYGYDAVISTFYVAIEAELLGSRTVVYAEDGPPNVGHLVIRAREDIARLEVPADFSGHPRFREQAECIRILKREAGGRFPIVAVVTGSFSLPAILMGIADWMELLYCGSASDRAVLLEKCSEFCRREIAALREAGSDLVIYTNSVATSSVIPLKVFEELALPALHRDLDGLGTGDIVYFNGGGVINPQLRLLMERTGVRAYYINPFDDVAEAKRILGGQAVLVSSINDIRLVTWTPEEIDREVERIMCAGKPGGGFVFGTLMMPVAIPERNIRLMLDAAYRHGRYAA